MALTAVAFLLVGPSIKANKASASLRAQGDELELNLDHAEAFGCFLQSVDADPGDPAAQRAVAGSYFLEIAFRRGAVTADDFLGGDVRAETVTMPKPPQTLANAFREYADRGRSLAEQRLRANPGDAEAHYQVGASIALQASYAATIDGQLFSAFKLARHAYDEDKKVLELDPQRKDASLIVGMYEYVASTLSFPVRWLARLAGMGVSKAHGIQLINEAAQYPGENRSDARLALVLIYNRERRYDEALALLKEAQEEFPRNRLLWLEAGATALRAGHAEAAERFFETGFVKLSQDARPRAFGEEALWHYKRGAARVRLGRVPEARSDLQAALSGDGRDWVRGRAHIELGKLADLAGDRNAALHEYRTGVSLGKADRDSDTVTEAEHLMAHPYQASQRSTSSTTH